MVISTKYFNSCTLYILLWGLYSLQGTLYASGSIISQGLLAIIMLFSVYYAFIVNIQSKALPFFLKVLNVFLLMLTAYGGFLILSGKTIYFNFTLSESVSPITFLKEVYISLLPVYAFYHFYITHKLTDDVIRIVSVFLLVVTTFSFIRKQNELLTDALSVGSTKEEFTNNTAYGFLGLLPLAFFWSKKPLLQYLFAAYIFIFIVAGMKRGAILIGAICFVWFVYRTWKAARGNQRTLITTLTIIIAILGFRYVSDFYATSEYFQRRVEQTAEGGLSNRDVIYSTLWNHFINETSVTKILFGNGALQTLSISGSYAHNDWLEILTCHGIVGVLIYVLYFIALVKHWIRSKHNILVYNILGMTIIIMFASTLFSMSYNNLSLSIVLCLGYCLGQLQLNKSTQHERY